MARQKKSSSCQFQWSDPARNSLSYCLSMGRTLAATEAKPGGGASPNALASAIAAHPFLQGMDPKHLALLTACAMQTQFPKGHLIFREGDLANRFYLIREGRVALESRIPGGEVVPIQVLSRGAVLGWSWLFPPYYWHFDARVVEPTRAIFFYGTRLRGECDEDHDLGYELIKRMAAVAIKRMQAAREEMLALYKRGGPGRI
jgi:CRP/FNR family transcriptional regulator, cyclic AMP receptor protein